MPQISTLNRILLTAFAITFSTATPASAVVILPNLPAGSQYQLVFVSADGRDTSSNNIVDYNMFVTQEAAANQLLPSTSWHAIASTPTINAINNVPTFSSIPIYNTHGELVAHGTSDFWFPVHSSLINYDQFGLLTSKDVWTGSNPNGSTANAFGVPFASSTYGRSGSSVAGEWTFFAVDAAYQARRLYAVSSTITIPVPEPGSLALLFSALLFTAGSRLCHHGWRIRGQ